MEEHLHSMFTSSTANQDRTTQKRLQCSLTANNEEGREDSSRVGGRLLPQAFLCLCFPGGALVVTVSVAHLKLELAFSVSSVFPISMNNSPLGFAGQGFKVTPDFSISLMVQ